jgi:hypothetical protein
MLEQIIILCRMKVVFLFFSVALLLTFGACSATDQGATRVGQRLQDGLQGRGEIVPNNPTGGSFGADYR